MSRRTFRILAGALLLSAHADSKDYKRQAETVASQPWKLAVEPLADVGHVGQPITFRVMILNARNQQVKTATGIHFTVSVQCGEATAQELPKKGIGGTTSTETVTWTPTVSGPCTVIARHVTGRSTKQLYRGRLLDGTNSVYILPRSPRQKAEFQFYPAASPFAGKPDRSVAAFTALPEVPGPPRDDGQLVIQVVARSTGVEADGKDAAIVKVFWTAGEAPKKDVHIWFSTDHGSLANPLVLRAGARAAETSFTSEWEADATIRFVSVSPPLSLHGDKTAWEVRFVRAVRGFDLIGPGKVSLVDRPTLHVRFYDNNGRSAGKDVPQRVTFTPKDTNVTVSPEFVDLVPKAWEARTKLQPVAVGRSEIEISTDEFAPKLFTLSITIGILIACCVAGGLIGSHCAYLQKRERYVATLFTGLVGALVLATIYVFGLIPILQSDGVRNMVSVIVVAIVGGFAGIHVLVWLRDRLTPQPAV